MLGREGREGERKVGKEGRGKLAQSDQDLEFLTRPKVSHLHFLNRKSETMELKFVMPNSHPADLIQMVMHSSVSPLKPPQRPWRRSSENSTE